MRRGLDWHGLVGMAGVATQGKTWCDMVGLVEVRLVRFGWAVLAGPGLTRRVLARQVVARRGIAGVASLVQERHGQVWRCKARLAWLGAAGHDEARRGDAGVDRLVSARLGEAWRGRDKCAF